MLQLVEKDDIDGKLPNPVDEDAESTVRGIIGDVQKRGWDALYEYAVRFGDVEKDKPLIISKKGLAKAAGDIDPKYLALLERCAKRIETFALAQLKSVREVTVPIPGGVATQHIAAVERAGCYAPGGRFPLPSSVLMTAVTARAAGVPSVWVASPRPAPITLAAAHVAGVDGLIAAGGAQVVAAFAYGAGDVPRCDVIVGPGNRYVTAAKKAVSGAVAIDMLAGPSELAVLADESANPQMVAADLLAQAEHDVVALPVLVTTSHQLLENVQKELAVQLDGLDTQETARASVARGFAVLVDSIDEGLSICDKLAPEHLEVICADAQEVAARAKHYGGMFIGAGTAEVFGDYGAGPNHTLPTGGTARYTGGLSVFHFLRIRTSIDIRDARAARQLAQDSVMLAELEGLAGHAASARHRLEL